MVEAAEAEAASFLSSLPISFPSSPSCGAARAGTYKKKMKIDLA